MAGPLAFLRLLPLLLLGCSGVPFESAGGWHDDFLLPCSGCARGFEDLGCQQRPPSALSCDAACRIPAAAVRVSLGEPCTIAERQQKQRKTWKEDGEDPEGGSAEHWHRSVGGRGAALARCW